MLPSGLPERVEDGADIARFLTHSNHFSSIGVKQGAFLPDRQGSKSVCRHGNEPAAELWALARCYFAPGTKVYAAAICKAADIRAAQLELESSEPPPRHADIVGWPTDPDPVFQKSEQKKRALLVCERAGVLALGSPIIV